jgi:hypothetical protein
MIKRVILIMLFGLIRLAAMAQEGESGKLFSSPMLNKITVLKDLTSQIVQAENAQAVTSRNNAAKAKQKVTELYLSYEKELENQMNIHSNDAKFANAIEEELNLVRKKIINKSPK